MRASKLINHNETINFQQNAEPQSAGSRPEDCGGTGNETPGGASTPREAVLSVILRSWSRLAAAVSPAFLSRKRKWPEALRVLRTQQRRGALRRLDHRLLLGGCGAVCLALLTSCQHCPMCGRGGAGAPGGKPLASKERTAQARLGAPATGSAQRPFETPIRRNPR